MRVRADRAFADPIALLEASLPRLSYAQSPTTQRRAGAAGLRGAGGGRAGGGGWDGGSRRPAEVFRDLPRIVSLHQK